MRRTPFVCFVLLLSALPARAADEVKLSEAYWQRLAGAGWVDFDADFNPVFHLETGYYFAKTGKFVKYRDGGPKVPAYFDRAGRVWVKDDAATHLWNGSKWEKLDFGAQHLFDDSAGRVFAFDGTHVRVLDKDGKWAAQEISKKAREGKVGFAEQGGRVWMWVWGHGQENERDLGAWSLTDGKWKHHTIANGFYFHSVRCMYPLADARFVVVEYRRPGSGEGPPLYWHPDKKVPPNEMQVIPGAGPSGRWEVAYGTDGTLYLGGAHASNSNWIALDEKGKRHAPPTVNLYASGVPLREIGGRHIVFGKFGDSAPVLPADGEFLGADRDGCFYFRPNFDGWRGYSKGATVTIAWPKHEKPGDILRVEKEKFAVSGIVKDEVGKLWAQPVSGGGLLQRHGGKWIDTPVQQLFHPIWTARPASPWSQWTWNSGHLFRLHGKNGSVLVVRIRDIYQLDEPPKDAERFPPRVVRDPAFPHPAPPPPVPVGKEKPLYWLEAWLFRDGKWSGPTEIRKLLATESATLLSDFPTTSGEMSFFSLVNDGARLWVAFDGKVLTSDKTGKVIEADWPLAKPKTPLPFVMLSKLPDGKVLLSGAHTLSLSPDGKIASEAILMPEKLPPGNSYEVRAHWKLAKDGTLWYWTASVSNLGVRVWHFRAGKWDEKKGVGLPLHEDVNGDLWCLTEPRHAGKVLLVNGTATKEFAFGPEEHRGITTIPKGAIVWAMGDRLYCLEPGAKPVLRWCVLSESVYGVALAIIDDKGTVLLGDLRGTLK